MMLKKVTICVLIFVAIIVSFHNGPVNGKYIHFFGAVNDKLYNCQDIYKTASKY